MQRLIGTLAIHAILGASLIAMHHTEAPHDAGDAIVATIALVDPAPESIPATIAPARATASPAGGSHRPTRGAPRGPVPTTVVGIVGEVGIDHDGNGTGTGTGTGTGAAGPGTGLGLGIVDEIPRPPPPPPAARVSKARSARLIFPSRQVATAEAELFIARLEIDDDGFVVGAHLARGFGGRRDDVAMSAVFRFRYDPARDDDGRAIRSTVEQHFDLGR